MRIAMRALRLLVLLSVVACASSQTAPKSSGKTKGSSSSSGQQHPAAHSAAHAHEQGPYSPIGAMLLDSAKKTYFFQLLKKMRANKNSDLPDAQKNATRRAQNAEMQKLYKEEAGRRRACDRLYRHRSCSEPYNYGTKEEDEETRYSHEQWVRPWRYANAVSVWSVRGGQVCGLASAPTPSEDTELDVGSTRQSSYRVRDAIRKRR